MSRLTCFFPLLFTGAICAQEININHIVSATCQVESGCVYNGYGAVSGKWKRGGAGEVGFWQISPVVLRGLGASRVAAGTAQGGEAIFREHFLHLYAKTGSYYWAAAAYNGGMGGRARRAPREYAERVIALAERLASEETK